jgi:hypothetical protein
LMPKPFHNKNCNIYLNKFPTKPTNSFVIIKPIPNQANNYLIKMTNNNFIYDILCMNYFIYRNQRDIKFKAILTISDI